MSTSEYRAELDPRAVRRLLTRLALIVVVLIALFQAISVYVENLWFQSVGYSAVYWYQLRAQGTPMPTNDLWIAALVLEHGLTLYSRDAHFQGLPQLSLA